MTYEFKVQIDLHVGERRVSATQLALALHRVIEHAKDCDIEGAELLDQRFGQVSVKVLL